MKIGKKELEDFIRAEAKKIENTRVLVSNSGRLELSGHVKMLIALVNEFDLDVTF